MDLSLIKPDGGVVRACPFLARAWWGEDLVAESRATFRLDVPGEEPSLWWPWEAVRVDRFRAGDVELWGGGEVERFDADGSVPPRAEPVAWSAEEAAVHDGTGVVRRWRRTPDGLDSLVGYATIDHEQARVELVDAVEGDDARDITSKRIPTWGDAADLVAVLGGGVAISNPRRPVVEGSQLLGQAIVAAMRSAPGRRVVSAHMAFLRVADAAHPVDIELRPLTEGRTFSAYTAGAMQGGRLVAAGTLLLGVPAVDVVQHEPRLDGVTGPYDAVPYDMGVTGRDLRVVDAAYADDPGAPPGPPTIDAWVRFRAVPDDPGMHAGLLAQFTGHMSIAAALRPHAGVGQSEAHRTISTAINAIAISFHADVRMDRWVLYRHLATVVHDGMAHSECRVHDEAGALLASFSVDAMIRPLERHAVDARTAL